MTYKLVAIKTENGKCVQMFTCRNVDETEFNRLQNQINEDLAKKDEEKKEFEELFKELIEEVKSLKEEIKILKGETE